MKKRRFVFAPALALGAAVTFSGCDSKRADPININVLPVEGDANPSKKADASATIKADAGKPAPRGPTINVLPPQAPAKDAGTNADAEKPKE